MQYVSPPPKIWSLMINISIIAIPVHIETGTVFVYSKSIKNLQNILRFDVKHTKHKVFKIYNFFPEKEVSFATSRSDMFSRRLLLQFPSGSILPM